jgi:hypothetical protein
MNLEQRYNSAPESTYVGKVRARQAAEAGEGPGVNFLDGDQRGTWSPASEAAPDTMQKEFTRNAAGDFRYGGGGKVPGGTNDGSFPLSRWLDKSLKIAFGGVGPASLPNGYWGNTRFTTIRDARNAGTNLHNYAPVPGRAFQEADILSELSKSKITGSPSGPAPAGLNG